MNERVLALSVKFPDGQLTLEYIKSFTHKMGTSIHFANLEQFIQ